MVNQITYYINNITDLKFFYFNCVVLLINIYITLIHTVNYNNAAC